MIVHAVSGTQPNAIGTFGQKSSPERGKDPEALAAGSSDGFRIEKEVAFELSPNDIESIEPTLDRLRDIAMG